MMLPGASLPVFRAGFRHAAAAGARTGGGAPWI
jgi:hypothetical protein